MSENTSFVRTPEDVSAQRLAEARRRKEKREAKIKAGGSARLNRITGLGGGVERDSSPTTWQQNQDTPEQEEHTDPDEVDISQHFYQPAMTTRSTNSSSTILDRDSLQQRLLAAEQNQILQNTGQIGEDAESDPMAAMLAQMMKAMGGGMPGFSPSAGSWSQPEMPTQSQPNHQARKFAPSTPASVWRIAHFVVALALGLFVALATPFSGTWLEREEGATAFAASPDGPNYNDVSAGVRGYFFLAFATAETLLLSGRLFLERGGRGGAEATGNAGALSLIRNLLPPIVRRNVDITTRYWQILSNVRSDLLVCVFVLGVCSWLRG